MIYCVIDGKKAFPSATASIKLTLENPYIKSTGNHTLQVSFPLDLPENRLVFGNVNRMDVSKKRHQYDDCTLFCGSIVLLSGSAAVTSYSDTEIKLQLLGTSADVMTKAEKIFIDEIDFPPMEAPYLMWCKKSNLFVDANVFAQGYGGIKGKYVFFTVRNETTGKKYNRLRCYGTPVKYQLKRPVLQVNLMYALKFVFRSVGYELKENAYDCLPWNELYVVNLNRTTRVGRALPHWKASTFLDEFRKLFNAVFVYDEVSKTVSVGSYSNLHSLDRVGYPSEDSFSSEYDEDGVSYIGSDNIKYDLTECDDQVHVREVSDNVFESFDVREYDSLSEMLAQEASRTKMELLTTFYIIKNVGYVYWRIVDEESGYMNYEICGYFDMLVKEGNTRSSSTTELKMIPVAVGESFVNESEIQDKCMMPCMEGPDDDASPSVDGDEEDTITVQDVLEEGMTVEKDTEDEHLQLAFLEGRTESFRYDNRDDRFYGILKAFTDQRESNVTAPWSMGLAHSEGIRYNIGRFHEGSVAIDSHVQYVKKFLCDEIPDPKKIFIFANKPFICSKIDLNITDSGIDRLKTGYFYEML